MRRTQLDPPSRFLHKLSGLQRCSLDKQRLHFSWPFIFLNIMDTEYMANLISILHANAG